MWEEYRDVVQTCSQGAYGTALSDGCEKWQVVFYRYIGQKWKAEESVPPLIDEKGELAATDTEKPDVLNKNFASVFTGSCASHILHTTKPVGRDWENKIPSTTWEEQVWDCLMWLNVYGCGAQWHALPGSKEICWWSC